MTSKTLLAALGGLALLAAAPAASAYPSHAARIDQTIRPDFVGLLYPGYGYGHGYRRPYVSRSVPSRGSGIDCGDGKAAQRIAERAARNGGPVTVRDTCNGSINVDRQITVTPDGGYSNYGGGYTDPGYGGGYTDPGYGGGYTDPNYAPYPTGGYDPSYGSSYPSYGSSYPSYGSSYPSYSSPSYSSYPTYSGSSYSGGYPAYSSSYSSPYYDATTYGSSYSAPVVSAPSVITTPQVVVVKTPKVKTVKLRKRRWYDGRSWRYDDKYPSNYFAARGYVEGYERGRGY